MRFFSVLSGFTPACCFVCCLLFACSTPGPNLFTRKSPHEQYGQHITDAGLRETALGRLWFQASAQRLAAPLTVSLPYAETGYFAAERPEAIGVQFSVHRGEKIRVTLAKKPETGFLVYLDIWEAGNAGGKPKLVASADTAGNPLEYDVKNDGRYMVTLQPELLKSGEYNLTIQAGPSLAFPLPSSVKTNIGSFWGAARDKGERRHEGIDIFAPFRTPALAAASGIVTRVEENTLGGKVVFLRPYDKDYTLYYAHLDTQLVHDGQQVATGDTLGLTGNTGNAKYTPSHLHLGIYTTGGAINPLPFVRGVQQAPARVSAPLVNLGRKVRTSRADSRLYDMPDTKESNTTALKSSTLLLVEAATGSWYRVVLPDGRKGFLHSGAVSAISTPLKRVALHTQMPLLEAADTLAPHKKLLHAGESINILAGYGDYYYVSDKEDTQGWMRW